MDDELTGVPDLDGAGGAMPDPLRDAFWAAQAAVDAQRAQRDPAPLDQTGAGRATPPLTRVTAPTAVGTSGSAPEGATTPPPGTSRAADPRGVTHPPAEHAGRRRGRHWAQVAVIIVIASIASLGVAHFKLGGGSSVLGAAGLDGTAFEGTIQPAVTFTIAAPGGVVVQQVLVSVGDTVTAGQPLLVTEDRDAGTAREAAVLELRAADARMDDVRRRLAVLNRQADERRGALNSACRARSGGT